MPGIVVAKGFARGWDQVARGVEVQFASSREPQWIDDADVVSNFVAYQKSAEKPVRIFMTLSCFGIELAAKIMKDSPEVKAAITFKGLVPAGIGLHLKERFYHHIAQDRESLQSAFGKAQAETYSYFKARAEKTLERAKKIQDPDMRLYLKKSAFALLEAAEKGVRRSRLLIREELFPRDRLRLIKEAS